MIGWDLVQLFIFLMTTEMDGFASDLAPDAIVSTLLLFAALYIAFVAWKRAETPTPPVDSPIPPA